MQGSCDACGKQAELTEYRRKWLGGQHMTSLLCSDCLNSIRKRRNRKHDALAVPIPPEIAPVDVGCGTEPFLSEDEQRRLAQKQADFRPSITVIVDGEELIRFTGKNPTDQPSGRRFASLRREVQAERDLKELQHG